MIHLSGAAWTLRKMREELAELNKKYGELSFHYCDVLTANMILANCCRRPQIPQPSDKSPMDFVAEETAPDKLWKELWPFVWQKTWEENTLHVYQRDRDAVIISSRKEKDTNEKEQTHIVAAWRLDVRDGTTLVVGQKAGAGKSLVLNLLVGEEHFRSGDSAEAVTDLWNEFHFKDQVYVDAPGFAARSEERGELNASQIEKTYKVDGDLRIVFVTQAIGGRFDEDSKLFKKLLKALGYFPGFRLGILFSMPKCDTKVVVPQWLDILNKEFAVEPRWCEEDFHILPQLPRVKGKNGNDTDKIDWTDPETKRIRENLSRFVNSRNHFSIKAVETGEIKTEAYEHNRKRRNQGLLLCVAFSIIVIILGLVTWFRWLQPAQEHAVKEKEYKKELKKGRKRMESALRRQEDAESRYENAERQYENATKQYEKKENEARQHEKELSNADGGSALLVFLLIFAIFGMLIGGYIMVYNANEMERRLRETEKLRRELEQCLLDKIEAAPMGVIYCD